MRLFPLTMVMCLLCALVFPRHVTAQPLAAGRDKFLGTATNSRFLRNLAGYWNQVTPSNAGKWGTVEAVQGQYDWSGLDAIYEYATKNGLMFKEHTLVWGNQQPPWLKALDSAGQRAAVEGWIRNLGQRYPAMAMVDVVNEPLNGPPHYANSLGGAGKTGWDWIITSFELARKYCPPQSKLILNEYNIVHNTSAATTYLEIVGLLKERNLIDGIGVQGHYFEFRSDIADTHYYVHNIDTIRHNLKRLTDTGLPVYITEFDIDEPIDSNQVAQYKNYFPLFWDNPGVKGVTFWGALDWDVWDDHPNTVLLRADGTERAALQWLRAYIAGAKTK